MELNEEQSINESSKTENVEKLCVVEGYPVRMELNRAYDDYSSKIFFI